MNINATLIVEMLAFVVFVLFNMFVVWPPISRALEKRRATIAEGLASADQGRQALEIARREGEQLVSKAREQAQTILRQAEERANAIVDEAVGKGRTEAERVVAEARKEIDNEVRNARKELYSEISGLALKAAGRVVMEDLDDSKHHKIVDDLVKSWS